MKLIFLDIDGVLNGEHRYANGYCGIDPECVKYLNRIIEATGATIVVSSAWRYMIRNGTMRLEGFRYLLLIHGLDYEATVFGTTPSDEAVTGRGEQIQSVLDQLRRRGELTSYVVLDNGSDEPPRGLERMTLSENLEKHHPDRWVKTVSHIGLTAEDADRAIAILERPA